MGAKSKAVLCHEYTSAKIKGFKGVRNLVMSSAYIAIEIALWLNFYTAATVFFIFFTIQSAEPFSFFAMSTI